MELGGSGLKVWYDTPDAPAPARTVRAGAPLALTLGVSPPHPSNTAEVCYRVNDGPKRALRARLLRTEYAGGRQYFRAIFPYIPPESTVDYGPVVQCAGRRAGVAPSGPLPSSFLVAPATSPVTVSPKAADRDASKKFPESMVFLARTKVQLASRPEIIGDTPDGLHLDFPLVGGTAEGPRLNGIYGSFGGDWLRVRTDGVGLPNIHATLRTKDDALVMLEATGKLDFGPDGYANASKGIYPPIPPLVLSIEFLTAAPDYNWLNRIKCVGIGHVHMAELLVHYDLYGILSLS